MRGKLGNWKNTRKNIKRSLIIIPARDQLSGPGPEARSSLPGELQRLRKRKMRRKRTSRRLRRRDWGHLGWGWRRDWTGSVPEADKDWAVSAQVTISSTWGRDSWGAGTSWAAHWRLTAEEAISLLTRRWKTFRVKEAFVSAWARGSDRDTERIVIVMLVSDLIWMYCDMFSNTRPAQNVSEDKEDKWGVRYIMLIWRLKYTQGIVPCLVPHIMSTVHLPMSFTRIFRTSEFMCE